MARKKHTKEQIMQTLINLAGRLDKDTLSQRDISMHLAGVISVSSINRYFGNLGNALKEAGLKRGNFTTNTGKMGNLPALNGPFRSK
jgi:hypothetical protein